MTFSRINNILQSAANTVYNWHDVVSAAGRDIELKDGVYFVSIEIVVLGTLNIRNKNIVFKRPISTDNTGNGVINFGEVKTDSNDFRYTVNGCHVTYRRNQSKMGGYVRSDNGNASLRQNTQRHVNYYNTNVFLECLNNRMDLFVSNCIDSSFNQAAISGSNQCFLYTQKNSINANCTYRHINNLETTGDFAELTAPKFYECNYNILNWDSNVTMQIREMVSIASRTNDFWLGSGAANNGFRFIDSVINFNNARLQRNTNRRYKSASINLSVVDTNGVVPGAEIKLVGSSPDNSALISFTRTTDGSGGISEIIADIFSDIGQVSSQSTDHSMYRLTINSYQHRFFSETIVLSSRIGLNRVAPAQKLISLDSHISITQAEVEALTDIAGSAQLYHIWRAHKRIDDTLPEFEMNADSLITDGVNLTRLQLATEPTQQQIDAYNNAPLRTYNSETNTYIIKVGATADDYAAATFTGSINCGTGTFTANGIAVTGSVLHADGLVASFTGLPTTGVVGAWLASQGLGNRTGIIAGGQINGVVQLELQPNTEYYIVADAIGYARMEAVLMDTTNQSTLAINLSRIVDETGSDLVPMNLNDQEQQQADMLSFDPITFTAVINANEQVHDFSFNAVAYYIESVQSSGAFLASPTTIGIRTAEFVLAANSFFKLGRNPNATAVPDLSAFTFRKEGSTKQTDFINFDNGGLIINSNRPIIVSNINVTVPEGSGGDDPDLPAPYNQVFEQTLNNLT